MLHSPSCNGSAPFYGQHTIVGYSIYCFSSVISCVSLNDLTSAAHLFLRYGSLAFHEQNQEIKQFKSAPG
jgi:hypothetical protein